MYNGAACFHWTLSQQSMKDAFIRAGTIWFLNAPIVSCYRFEPDMLAFSGCDYGGGDKEQKELGAIRKRWKTLHVRLKRSIVLKSFNSKQCQFQQQNIET